MPHAPRPTRLSVESTPWAPVRLSLQTVRMLFDTAPEPTMVVDADQRLRYANPAFIDMCGLRPRVMRGLMRGGVQCADLIRLEGFCEGACTARAAMERRHPVGLSSVKATVSSRPDEHLIVGVTATPLDDFDGGGCAVLEIFRDTTAEHRVQAKYQGLLQSAREHGHQLEAKVRERTLELEERNRAMAKAQDELLQATRLAAVGEVAGSAAHEVLNPLNAIIGQLDQMRAVIDVDMEGLGEIAEVLAEEGFAPEGPPRETIDSPSTSTADSICEVAAVCAAVTEIGERMGTRRHVMGTLMRAGRRIERIVQSMRGLSRPASEPDARSLQPLLDEVRDLMSYSFERDGVGLSVERCGSLAVFVDHCELVQVLTNLLRNACQAARMAQGAIGGRVKVTARNADSVVEIRVIDNGTGVPETLAERIFDAGFSTRSGRDGTGLGLSISRRLMRGGGGDLMLEHTDPGHGTTMMAVVLAANGDGTTKPGTRDDR